MFFSSQTIKGLILAAAGFMALPVHAEALNQAIKADLATTEAAIRSQKKIAAIDDKTQTLLEEYRSATRQTETLQVYNRYLQDLLESQRQEKQSLQRQLDEIEITQREILPLALRMLDSLEKFISLDMPFLPEERKQRLENLQQMMKRADVTNAEKFRRILEAFQIENDYGNSIEAYRGDLALNGSKSSVDFLRLGRLALYYQRLDGSETGYWNKEQKHWEKLPEHYRQNVRTGLRIARKEMAPDLIVLPLPAAEDAK